MFVFRHAYPTVETSVGCDLIFAPPTRNSDQFAESPSLSGRGSFWSKGQIWVQAISNTDERRRTVFVQPPHWLAQ